MSKILGRTCECGCGKSLAGKRRHARFYEDACKSRVKRRRRDPLIGSPERRERKRAGLQMRYASKQRWQARQALTEAGLMGAPGEAASCDPRFDPDDPDHRRESVMGSLYEHGKDSFSRHEPYLGFRDGENPEPGWHSGPYWPVTAGDRERARERYSDVEELRFFLEDEDSPRARANDVYEQIELWGKSRAEWWRDELHWTPGLMPPTRVYWDRDKPALRKFDRKRDERLGQAPTTFECDCGKAVRLTRDGSIRHSCQPVRAVEEPVEQLPPMKWSHSEAYFKAMSLDDPDKPFAHDKRVAGPKIDVTYEREPVTAAEQREIFLAGDTHPLRSSRGPQISRSLPPTRLGTHPSRAV